MKLLCLCDSPTETTGFAKVAANLLREWRGHFGGGIDVWGINYLGWPHQLPYRIFPGGRAGWNHPNQLRVFLELIANGDYTHVWIMQDTFALSKNSFPTALRDVCRAKRVKTALYFPVDAPLDPEWAGIVQCVDVAVAYTDYGRREAEKWAPRQFVHVLPHGVDTKVFAPMFAGMDREKKRALRGELRADLLSEKLPWGGFRVAAGDRLLVNVNVHSRRKGLAQSLEILARLKDSRMEAEPEWKLLMHMDGIRPDDQTDLESAGRQLGLDYGVDWKHTGGPNGWWRNGDGLLAEEDVNRLYNAADGVLTTTLGEGWGFCITEGLAAGVPVFAPDHTSCGEIARRAEETGSSRTAVRTLPVGESGVMLPWDNSRVRYPVDSAEAAWVVAQGIGQAEREGVFMGQGTKEWLSWPRIAGEWVRLFKK